MRIEYDDQLWEVVDKVNQALKPHGLKFVDYGTDGDGFVDYVLEKEPTDKEVALLRVASAANIVINRSENDTSRIFKDMAELDSALIELKGLL